MPNSLLAKTEVGGRPCAPVALRQGIGVAGEVCIWVKGCRLLTEGCAI